MPSPLTMMESTGVLQRGATGRDAQGGMTQDWTDISLSVPCSIQPANAEQVILLFKQRNSNITTIVYLAQDIGAQVNDRFIYSSPGGVTGLLKVLELAQQVNRGLVWRMGCAENTPASTPGAAAFVVTAPGTASIGMPFSFTVQAVDALGNDVSSYAGTVAFYAFNNPFAVLLGPTAITGGVGTFLATINIATTQQLYVQDINNVQLGGFSGNVVVS